MLSNGTLQQVYIPEERVVEVKVVMETCPLESLETRTVVRRGLHTAQQCDLKQSSNFTCGSLTNGENTINLIIKGAGGGGSS